MESDKYRLWVNFKMDNKAVIEDDHLWTVDNVAAFLSIHKNSVYKMARSGKIPARRIGHDWRFLPSEIKSWLDDQRMYMVILWPECTVNTQKLPGKGRFFAMDKNLEGSPYSYFVGTREEAEQFKSLYNGILISR